MKEMLLEGSKYGNAANYGNDILKQQAVLESKIK